MKQPRIRISLDEKQARFLSRSLNLLMSTLDKMDSTDRLIKYGEASGLAETLISVPFGIYLKSISVEIDSDMAEAICHSMYSLNEIMFGMCSSEAHNKLEDIQRSIWEQIYDKFDKAESADGESDPKL